MRAPACIRLTLGLMLLALAVMPAGAAPKFPPLTGRVVDDAHLLTAAQQQTLSAKLATEEKKTSNQVVVVTLPSLQGYTIDQYGYQLGRDWGIGQKKRNNGVLLIVAPNEHKVRIEVGYGLEGALTDALSSIIIRNDILPAFRKGDYYQGINNGVNSILKAIAGEYKAKPKPRQSHGGAALLYLLGLVVITVLLGFGGFGGGGPGRRRGGFLFLPIGMGGFGGGFGGGGGGFGGGGGGFGGGGASGGW